jgi:hypothetical protein
MEDNFKNYTPPLSEKITELEAQGYKSQFKVENGKLVDISMKKEYAAGEIIVKEKFRFEGESNPDDTSILYVLECNDGGKGTLVNAYGMYGDEEIDQFVTQIPGEGLNL